MESGHTNIEDDFWGYQIFLPPFGPCQLINPNNLLKSIRMFTPLKESTYRLIILRRSPGELYNNDVNNKKSQNIFLP